MFGLFVWRGNKYVAGCRVLARGSSYLVVRLFHQKADEGRRLTNKPTKQLHKVNFQQKETYPAVQQSWDKEKLLGLGFARIL